MTSSRNRNLLFAAASTRRDDQALRVATRQRRSSAYSRWGKRTIDLAVGSVALVVTAPIQLVVAALVRAKLGSPVLFRQQRPGKDEVIFEMLKFRTMTNDRDATGALLPDRQRLTRFGQILRSTSLDELPELVNVIRGDMSLVGPRPLVVRYLPHYSQRQRIRHNVRPGITGLAQVSGRNALSWPERLELDACYVENLSAREDVKILLLTVLQVLRRQGITGEGEVTVRAFDAPATSTVDPPQASGQ